MVAGWLVTMRVAFKAAAWMRDVSGSFTPATTGPEYRTVRSLPHPNKNDTCRCICMFSDCTSIVRGS